MEFRRCIISKLKTFVVVLRKPQSNRKYLIWNENKLTVWYAHSLICNYVFVKHHEHHCDTVYYCTACFDYTTLWIVYWLKSNMMKESY